jgi:hypothetical protein
MTWKELLDNKLAERHKTSREELTDLRNAIERNLDDAAVSQLSADNRFGLAYEGALVLAKMAIACAGYRVKGQGVHHTTFVALKLALGPGIDQTANYLERCRRKRNKLSYDAAGIATDQDATELLAKAMALQETVERWIASNHPDLK